MARSRTTSLVSLPLLTSWLLLVLQFGALCSAQEASSANVADVSSATSSTPAQTHTIQVGLADHKFQPDITKAAIGDTVEFRFFPANHSVVRAEYGYPCIPYEMTGPRKTGFFSGFNAVDKVIDDPPKYSIKINDTQPIFFYCSAPGSCITYSMVGAINPNTSTPIANQEKLAKNSAYMLNPGEPFPAEGPQPSDVPAANPSVLPLPSTPASKKSTLSPGAIAGIVIAALSVIILAALLFFFWGRTKSLKDEVERKETSTVRREDSITGILPPLSSAALSTHPDTDIFQLYAMSQVQAQSPPPQSHYNGSMASLSYLSPPQHQQALHQQTSQSQEHKYTSPTIAHHPAFSNLTAQADQHISPTTYELPHNTIISRTHSHTHQHPTQRSCSPHCLSISSSPTSKLGPYGVEQMGAAPPYGFHVNSQTGPQEMEGTPVGKEGEEKAEREREMERGWERRPRWEEVKGDEGGMF